MQIYLDVVGSDCYNPTLMFSYPTTPHHASNLCDKLHVPFCNAEPGYLWNGAAANYVPVERMSADHQLHSECCSILGFDHKVPHQTYVPTEHPLLHFRTSAEPAASVSAPQKGPACSPRHIAGEQADDDDTDCSDSNDPLVFLESSSSSSAHASADRDPVISSVLLSSPPVVSVPVSGPLVVSVPVPVCSAYVVVASASNGSDLRGSIQQQRSSPSPARRSGSCQPSPRGLRSPARPDRAPASRQDAVPSQQDLTSSHSFTPLSFGSSRDSRSDNRQNAHSDSPDYSHYTSTSGYDSYDDRYRDHWHASRCCPDRHNYAYDCRYHDNRRVPSQI